MKYIKPYSQFINESEDVKPQSNVSPEEIRKNGININELQTLNQDDIKEELYIYKDKVYAIYTYSKPNMAGKLEEVGSWVSKELFVKHYNSHRPPKSKPLTIENLEKLQKSKN